MSKPVLTLDVIIFEICNYFRLEIEDIMPKNRNRIFVYPRQLIFYFTRKLLTNSYTLYQIGDRIGKRDHSTVLHGISVVNDLLCYDKIVKYDVEEIEKILSEKYDY